MSDAMIQKLAEDFAEKKEIEFHPSNGWLQRLKTSYEMTSVAVCGEAATVDEAVVAEWKEKIPELTQGYIGRDIFNADETSLFYKKMPARTLKRKIDPYPTGFPARNSKERATVLLTVSKEGERLPPFIIWKCAKPRNLDVSDWNSNKTAWMTIVLFDSYLTALNDSMAQAGRNILLFLDNAPVHNTSSVYSNIKIQPLPPNTTTKTQPLDQGIIKDVKAYYKFLLSYFLLTTYKQAKNEGRIIPTKEIMKLITVPKVIELLNKAWFEKLKPSTIFHCFEQAGFAGVAMDQVQVENEEMANILASMTFDEDAILDIAEGALQDLAINEPNEAIGGFPEEKTDISYDIAFAPNNSSEYTV
jgi:hypothetical protein